MPKDEVAFSVKVFGVTGSEPAGDRLSVTFFRFSAMYLSGKAL